MAEITPNTALMDALIRHQIYLMRLAGSLRDEVLAFLDATEKDIKSQVVGHIDEADLETTFGKKRLQIIMNSIAEIRAGAIDGATDTWLKRLMELAAKEPEFVAGLIQTVAPVVLNLAIPPADQLEAIVTSKPFEGKTLKEWGDTLKAVDRDRIEKQLKIGLTQGESPKDIYKRIVGTVQLDGVDGATEITRRQAEAIGRTAINHIATQARNATYEANSDILDEEMFVATLDSRTTPVCRARDGQHYPVGEGPMPPLHYNCRSTRVPIFDGRALGTRPAKPTTEKLLRKEWDAMSDKPAGGFSKWMKSEIRKRTDADVPAASSYQTWLQRQPNAFQDEVLGPTRAKLFRDGGLELTRFVNRAGDELTLSDLAKLHADAFRSAGLDPEDFL